MRANDAFIDCDRHLSNAPVALLALYVAILCFCAQGFGHSPFGIIKKKTFTLLSPLYLSAGRKITFISIHRELPPRLFESEHPTGNNSILPLA